MRARLSTGSTRGGVSCITVAALACGSGIVPDGTADVVPLSSDNTFISFTRAATIQKPLSVKIVCNGRAGRLARSPVRSPEQPRDMRAHPAAPRGDILGNE